MAWGMFCWIPCPYRDWKESDRKAQLAMLPLVGTCIGVIVCLCWWVLELVDAGQIITGAVLTGAYFLLTGFIHLDGFMDCSDAVMPRHPEMRERQRILKDPHSGAFAVICVCLMLIIFTGAMVDIAPHFSLKACSILVVIFTVSRFMSTVEVLLRKPMSTSQYAQADGTMKDTIPAFIIIVLVIGASELILANGSLWAIIAELYSNITAVVVIVSAAVVCNNDIKKLGGMNGDISGHMITVSETMGVLTMALLLS